MTLTEIVLAQMQNQILNEPTPYLLRNPAKRSTRRNLVPPLVTTIQPARCLQQEVLKEPINPASEVDFVEAHTTHKHFSCIDVHSKSFIT